MALTNNRPASPALSLPPKVKEAYSNILVKQSSHPSEAPAYGMQTITAAGGLIDL
jgi:hypothetical protein